MDSERARPKKRNERGGKPRPAHGHSAAGETNPSLEQLLRDNRELSSQKELLSNIVNRAHDGIMLLDQEHRVLLFSPSCERITGWKAEEVRGRPCFEFFKCQHGLEHVDDMTNCPLNDLTAGAPDGFYMEMTVLTRDGCCRWVGASSALIQGDDPAGQRIVMIWRDITSLKEMDQMKSSIISTVSHELRTPLTSIRALSELLAEQDFSPSEAREMAASINRESVRLAELVDNVLNVARIEGGRIGGDRQSVDVVEVVRESVAALGLQKPLHRFELDLPTNQTLAVADPEGVRLTMDNLVSNALKYSPAGSTVHVSVRPNDGVVELTVRDEGVGLPAGEIEQIFDKFYRVKGEHSQRVSGVGLGLYIAKTLTEMSGGSIRVESELGRGSTFIVTLPR